MDKPSKTRPPNPRLRKDLLAELEHLRSEAKEISRIYVANLQRDMVQVIDFINSIETLQRNRRRQVISKCEHMKEILDAHKVKPEKGRRKDLRRRSEEHTSELQSQSKLVCRLLLEKHKS